MNEFLCWLGLHRIEKRMISTEQFVIEADLSRDATGYFQLPSIIGPFASRQEANDWLEMQGPLWGDSNVARLAHPTAVGSQSEETP